METFLIGVIVGIFVGCFILLIFMKQIVLNTIMQLNNPQKSEENEENDVDFWKPKDWRPDRP